MGSRAKARYFSSDRKIPSQNSLLVTKKFDWVLCGGDKRTRTVHLLNAIHIENAAFITRARGKNGGKMPPQKFPFSFNSNAPRRGVFAPRKG